MPGIKSNSRCEDFEVVADVLKIRTWSFRVVVLRRTAMKCTKIYSQIALFGDVFFAVAFQCGL